MAKDEKKGGAEGSSEKKGTEKKDRGKDKQGRGVGLKRSSKIGESRKADSRGCGKMKGCRREKTSLNSLERGPREEREMVSPDTKKKKLHRGRTVFNIGVV